MDVGRMGTSGAGQSPIMVGWVNEPANDAGLGNGVCPGWLTHRKRAPTTLKRGSRGWACCGAAGAMRYGVCRCVAGVGVFRWVGRTDATLPQEFAGAAPEGAVGD